eukprot:1324352-Amorphochlora_amoeboformis.AAC.2
MIDDSFKGVLRVAGDLSRVSRRRARTVDIDMVSLLYCNRGYMGQRMAAFAPKHSAYSAKGIRFVAEFSVQYEYTVHESIGALGGRNTGLM